MRTNVPQSFQMEFQGPEGRYMIDFAPIDEWDGRIQVTIAGQEMTWSVDNAERDEDGSLILGGTTNGSELIWNDVYWFELRLDVQPAVMRFWGDRVIWREDSAVMD